MRTAWLPVLAFAALLTGGCVGTPTAVAPPSAVPAAVVERLDVHTRKPAFAGRTFGAVGAYEFIAGVATVRVDPRHAANRAVVDLPLSADPDGQVRFRTDVVILRPVDPARASRAMVVDIANRGNKLALGRLADGGTQMDTAEQAGHGWPMRQGHVLAWVGWQSDVPLGKAGERVGMQLPVAKEQGRTITGRSVEEFIFDDAAARSVGTLSYPAASLDASDAVLTVRANPMAPATRLPSSAWRYLDPLRIEIDRPAGSDAGAVYEFVYTARDPVVTGLGLVALRDVTLHLKSGARDAVGQANPLADLPPRTTVAMGISQSGRFLRDFLWLGFNAGPAGARVFDGAMPLIAGSRKSFVNQRFAQPGRYSRQHEDRWYPGDQFPFTYATTDDPVSGRRDGIFQRCAADRTCPKLMHLDSNLEFWQARASLVTTDGVGRPVPVPEDVRLYLMASTQHGPAAQPVAGICQQPANPAVQAPLARAAMARLIAWAGDGVAPPPSRFPAAADLVPPQAGAMGFPDLGPLGVRFPTVINELAMVDPAAIPYRPDATRRYQVRVPKTDADGHDIAGVRLPDVAVALATHSGWGLRKAGFAEGQLCGLNGIYVPLARQAADRSATRDPRLSVAERYPTRTAYVERVRNTSAALRDAGFLLDEDVQRFVERARTDPRVAFLPE